MEDARDWRVVEVARQLAYELDNLLGRPVRARLAACDGGHHGAQAARRQRQCAALALILIDDGDAFVAPAQMRPLLGESVMRALALDVVADLARGRLLYIHEGQKLLMLGADLDSIGDGCVHPLAGSRRSAQGARSARRPERWFP
jgi:hypothetical protein